MTVPPGAFALLAASISLMGVIESSAPRVKKIMPMTRSTAPNKNRSRIPGGIGAMVKLKEDTMAIIGRTAFSVLVSFSAHFVWR